MDVRVGHHWGIFTTVWTFVGKVMPLLFGTLFRFVIAFLPRSRHLLISWLQSPSAVILKLKQIKSVTVSIVSPSISQEVMALDAMIFVYLMLSFKPAVSLSSFNFIKRLFSSSLLSVMRVVSSAYLRLFIFLLAILILSCASSTKHFEWCTHFTGNRWGNSGNSVRLYIFGLQNHCRWWLQPWN